MMNAPQSYILVVDDDTALLQALPQALSLRLPEIQVKTTDSAVHALELAQHYAYDAIVSDIKMPRIDCVVLLTRITGLRPQTPALLITAHGGRDPAIQALRLGA